jgi:hypothetical protein
MGCYQQERIQHSKSVISTTLRAVCHLLKLVQQLELMLQQMMQVLWPNPATTAAAVLQLQQHLRAAHPKQLLLQAMQALLLVAVVVMHVL